MGSATSIGLPIAQDDNVPVINTDNLVNRILEVHDLKRVGQWLNTRSYLPVLGEDFEVREKTYSVAGWTVTWHGAKPID